MCSDHGVENVHVARYMLRAYNRENGRMLTKLSVHNQRIETVPHVLLRSFQNLLFYMESEGLLLCDNEMQWLDCTLFICLELMLP